MVQYIGNKKNKNVTPDMAKVTKDFLSNTFKDNQAGLNNAFKEFKQTGTFNKGLETQFDMYRKKQEPISGGPAPAELNSATNGLKPKDSQIQPMPTSPTSLNKGMSNQDIVNAGGKVTDGIQSLPAQTTPKVNGRDWELGQAELDLYNTLSPEQQDAFWLKRDQLSKNQTDYTKELASFLKTGQQQKDYLKGQRDIQTKVDTLTGEIQNIQETQKLKEAEDSLSNLRQNLRYLGSMGAPGVSETKLEAVNKQLGDAKSTYDNLLTIQQKYKDIRELGLEYDANQFQKQMTDLQASLDKEVNSKIQNAYNELLAADANGELDTIQDIERFKTQVLANMDKEIAGITDKNFQERAFLIQEANNNKDKAEKRLQEIQKKQEEFIKNSNIVNKDMSTAQGYYVDGNGNPIISATTGTTIKIPEKAPMEPIFDKTTGKLITFSTDENGGIVANVEQVIDQPTFEQSTITSFANLVAQGKINFEDVPENVRNTQTFVSALEQSPLITEGKDRYINAGGGKVFDTSIGQFISETGTSTQGGINIDLSVNQELINKYPGEASFKNNNPTGITWGISNELKQMFDSAGVKYGIGTPRPKNEGGNYIKFATVEDGLKAYQIALTQRGDDVFERLKKWVGSANADNYANELMKEAGISKGAKFSELSEGQLNSLMNAQLRRESPAFYKELTSGTLSQTQTSGGPRGSLGVPISFERQIKQMVPAQLMNSEVELEALNDTITKLYKAGFSTQDATLTYMGFDISNPKNKDKAMKFIDIARTLGENLPDDYIPLISNYINNGQEEEAMNLTEKVARNSAKKELGTDYIPENVVKTAVQRSNELIKLVNDLEKTGENPIGQFSGTFENWLGRFKSKEAQTIATKATQLVAQMRNDLIGASATKTENTSIEPLIPQLTDGVDNFKIKVQNIGDEALREINNQRQTFGLPEIDLKSLDNKKSRLGLYLQTNTQQETKPDMGMSKTGTFQDYIDNYYGVSKNTNVDTNALFDKYYK